MLRAVALSLLFVAFVCSEDAEATKLPAAVQAALDKAEKDVAAEREKYDAAAAKILDATAKVIKAEQDKLTKAARLDEAVAVNKKLEEFRNAIMQKVDEKAKEKKDLPGPPIGNGSKAILGKWIGKPDDNNFTIEEGGVVRGSKGNIQWSGKWEVKGNQLILTFTGAVDIYDLPVVDNSLNGKNHNGLILKLVRTDK